MFVDERAIIVQLRWVLWSQRARRRSTRYLQISRWQSGADLLIIVKFIGGSEWGGPLVGCRLKFSNFVGSRLKFSIFVGSRLNFSIFVGCRKILVNK